MRATIQQPETNHHGSEATSSNYQASSRRAESHRRPRPREARLAAGRKAVTQQHGEVDVKPQGNGGAVVPAGKTDVALPDTRTPQQAYLDEIAPPSSLVGRPIKFDGKAGKWLFGDTDEEIEPGHRLHSAVRRNSNRLDQVQRQGRTARSHPGLALRRLYHAAAEHAALTAISPSGSLACRVSPTIRGNIKCAWSCSLREPTS